MSVLEGLFPEVGAGGFTRMEPRIQFYSRVRALLEPDHHVLEFGAGRGKFHYLENDPIKRITDISRIPARYALFDVDPVVLENPTSEDRHVAAVGESLSFEDGSFDIVVAWMVLEHITAPDFYARELGRVLKPGGWLCAVTPNKWGYFSVGARLIPERLHGTFLRWLVPHKKAEDGFETVYKLNTLAALERHFPAPDFSHHSYYYDPGPGYFGRSMTLARIIRAYNYLVPPFLLPHLFVFVQRRNLDRGSR